MLIKSLSRCRLNEHYLWKSAVVGINQELVHCGKMLIPGRYYRAPVGELAKVALAHKACRGNARIRYIQRMNVIFPGNAMVIQHLSNRLCTEQWPRVRRVNRVRMAL